MDLQPILENKIIRVRPLDSSDLENLYKVAKDPKIWKQHPCKRYLRTEFEKFFAESIESNGALTILDKTTDKIIGSTRFKKVDGFPNGVEIGWTFLDRKYWGGKYNKVVKDLMIEHSFNFVDNIIFYIDKANVRSQKAVEKIGGKRIEESEYGKSTITSSDNITFVIKKSEWK
ncbi:MAG: GNAT family N-acetyltransferase [Melioribacteraceae bacterium]